MIEAQHSFLAQLFFYPYLERLLKKNFSHFYFVNEQPKIDSESGLIITPNHFSWWDGFFIGYIVRKLSKRKIYIMMLENQLEKYWFFKKVGAYSINQSNPKEIIKTADYTQKIIRKENVVVIYPQGKIESFDIEDINIKNGLNLFTKNVNNNFYVVPVAFKIQYYEEKYPSIIVRFGDTIDKNSFRNNFEMYKLNFVNNIELLNKSAIKQNFIFDLFQKQK